MPLRPLKVDDHDCLEGLSLSVTEIGPIAPLLHSLDGGGCQRSVSLDQSQALNLASLINDCLKDDRSLGRARAGSDGVFWRNAVGQPLFRTLRRENDRAVLPGQWSVRRSCSGRIFLAVDELVAGLVSVRLGRDRSR